MAPPAIDAVSAGASLTLQPLDARQHEQLVTLWRESFEFGMGIADPHPIAEQLAYLRDQVLPAHAIQVALLGAQLVGFVAANRESVAQLFVRVGCHRRGIGRALLDWAKAQSHGSLWLYTFERNRNAQRFYERQGFRIVARGFEPVWQLDDIKYRWPAAPEAD